MECYSENKTINDNDKTYRIIGAAMAVHKELGCGFLEAVYGDALEQEFKLQGIPYIREKEITIEYKGLHLPHKYYADFVCFDSIIVELRAVESLHSTHRSQVIKYLNATGYELGLLINFGEPSLKFERFRN